MYKKWVFINLYRILPVFWIIQTVPNRKIINEDIERYMELDSLPYSRIINLGLLLLRKPEFVSQMMYRVKRVSRIKSVAIGMLFRCEKTLFINTSEIDGGLYIQHGFATIISASKVGKNCFINQQVTVGYEGKYAPIIGDNVRVCAGAKVIGNIHIGENSVIGANAVVVKDIPANVTVGGGTNEHNSLSRCCRMIRIDLLTLVLLFSKHLLLFKRG